MCDAPPLSSKVFPRGKTSHLPSSQSLLCREDLGGWCVHDPGKSSLEGRPRGVGHSPTASHPASQSAAATTKLSCPTLPTRMLRGLFSQRGGPATGRAGCSTSWPRTTRPPPTARPPSPSVRGRLAYATLELPCMVSCSAPTVQLAGDFCS